MLNDVNTWRAIVAPYVRIRSSYINPSEAPGAGTSASVQFNLPRSGSIALSSRVDYPPVIDLAQLSFSLPVYMGADIGTVERFYFPWLNLDLALGVQDLLPANILNSIMFARSSLSLNSLVKTGTAVTIHNTVLYRPSNDSWEDRVGVSADQLFRIFPRIGLGLSLSASAGFGRLQTFAAGNSTLGWSSVAPGGLPYQAGARAFLGLPLFNAVEAQVANMGVLQSLNAGFVYEIAAAFSMAGSYSFQHAAGIALYPLYRLISDSIPISGGIGVSFNLNRITGNPLSPGSYQPTVFADIGITSNAWASMISY
jgi:hypothetical protein